MSCLREILTSSSYGEGLENGSRYSSAPRQSFTRQNHGFDELVNGWHADHVYRHHSGAIECFLLLAFLAYNIFHAFFALNLRPELRHGRTMEFWVRLIAADLHAVPRFAILHTPP